MRTSPFHFETFESRVLFAITFQPPIQSNLGSFTVVASGDFNRDRIVDIVARGKADGMIRFFAGTGDGHFTPTNAATPVYAGANVVSIVTADFNRDGHLDFAAANGTRDSNAGSVAVLLGNGNGTFQPAKFYAGGPDPTALAVADLNADGRLDLVVSNQGTWPGGTDEVLFGGARLIANNAGFGAPIRIPLDHPSTAVVSLGGSATASSFYSVLKVAFAGPNLLSASPLPMTMLSIVMPMSGMKLFQGSLPGNNSGLAAANFNSDRRFDVAALQVMPSNSGLNSSPSVYTVASQFFSGTTSMYKQGGPFATGLDAATSIAAADLDRNGTGDVVLAGIKVAGPMLPAFYAAVATLPGTGTGELGKARTFYSGGIPNGLALGDANRDGRVDVITTSNVGAWTLLNSSPRPTLAFAVIDGEIEHRDRIGAML